MLRPLTRLAVRSARSRGRAGLAAFPCSANFTGWFRFALYTGSAWQRVSPRRATQEDPSLSACLLAQAYQSLWLVGCNDAYERSFSFNHVIQF